MSDLKQKIHDVLATPQMSSLATIAPGNKPWTRYVMAVADQDLTIRVATFLGSRKVAQLRANPEVHLNCGVNSLATAERYLQVEARAEIRTDDSERRGFWNDRLKAYFSGPDDPNFAVLVLKPYRIEYHSMQAREPEVWKASSPPVTPVSEGV